MKRLTLAASIMLAVSVPATAAAKPVSPQHAREYAHLYHKVAAKLGRRAPGRNITRWGLGPRKRVTDAQVLASIVVLERMLAPVLAMTTVSDTQVNSPVTAVSDTGAAASTGPQSAASTGALSAASTGSPTAASTGSSLPACTWQTESGGNPGAVNPTSGAGGYYQIMPSTWAAYGGSGSPQSASLGEQTAIAQKIYQSQGPGAWNNC